MLSARSVQCSQRALNYTQISFPTRRVGMIYLLMPTGWLVLHRHHQRGAGACFVTHPANTRPLKGAPRFIFRAGFDYVFFGRRLLLIPLLLSLHLNENRHTHHALCHPCNNSLSAQIVPPQQAYVNEPRTNTCQIFHTNRTHQQEAHVRPTTLVGRFMARETSTKKTDGVP